LSTKSKKDARQSATHNTRAEDHALHCECVICKNKRLFQLPETLKKAFFAGDVVIFAGAGISTEGPSVLRYTFYDEIKKEIGSARDDQTFSDLMSEFVKRPSGRVDLIRKLISRFRYIESMPPLYEDATRFHRELASLFTINTIITTNWDDYFERECDASPFTFSENIAFWDAAERRILKVHGTIENLSSLVVTSEDYQACYERLLKNMIGSQLKLLLASKNIVFCGYSFRDQDLQEIMKFVQTEMKGFMRQPYIVTLEDTEEARTRFEQFGLEPIITDASHFLSRVKQAHKELDYYISDGVYDACDWLLRNVRVQRSELLEKMNIRKHPTLIFSLFYYDGLTHALERIVQLRKSGAYSHRARVAAKIDGYRNIRAKLVKLSKYDDVAYVDGYIAALIFAAVYDDAAELEPPPPYYVYGSKRDIGTFAAYKRALSRASQTHKSSFVWAKKLIDRMRDAEGTQLFPSHGCWLSWPKD
jgi:hypothetical protein